MSPTSLYMQNILKAQKLTETSFGSNGEGGKEPKILLVESCLKRRLIHKFLPVLFSTGQLQPHRILLSLSSGGNRKTLNLKTQCTVDRWGTISKMGFSERRCTGEYEESYLKSLVGRKERSGNLRWSGSAAHPWVTLLGRHCSGISPGEIFKTPTGRSYSKSIKWAFLEYQCFLTAPRWFHSTAKTENHCPTVKFSSLIPSAFQSSSLMKSDLTSGEHEKPKADNLEESGTEGGASSENNRYLQRDEKKGVIFRLRIHCYGKKNAWRTWKYSQKLKIQ